MRQKHNPQTSIFEIFAEHETGQQLKVISRILDDNPVILDLAHACFVTPDKKETGRKGLSVDSIVRAALLKQMMGLVIRILAFIFRILSAITTLPGSRGRKVFLLPVCNIVLNGSMPLHGKP